ncbi:MAG TPA: hypothetical protein VGF91_32235 [Solirubrobacteraceae bacterium]
MTARELDDAGALLEVRRIRARDGFATAVTCGLAAAAALPFSPALGFSLLIGAAAAVLPALMNMLHRRDVIARLALDPNAYSLPEVRRYATRLALPAEREKLAAWLRELVEDAPHPGSLYLSDRVSRYARQFEFLASKLTSSWVDVRPDSAAACHHLLTHAAESPLYNAALPAEQLESTLERILRGITT